MIYDQVYYQGIVQLLDFMFHHHFLVLKIHFIQMDNQL